MESESFKNKWTVWLLKSESLKNGTEVKMKKLTPMKSIRAKCLDCCCGQPKEVRLCVIRDCPLHNYRFGKNSSRKGIGFGKKTKNKNIKVGEEKREITAI